MRKFIVLSDQPRHEHASTTVDVFAILGRGKKLFSFKTSRCYSSRQIFPFDLLKTQPSDHQIPWLIFFFFLQNLPRESKIGRRWKISRIILYNRRYKQFREINLSEILLFFARFLSARQLSSTGRVTGAKGARNRGFWPFPRVARAGRAVFTGHGNPTRGIRNFSAGMKTN